MDLLVLAARLLLAAVFLVAGLAKLTDLEGSRRSVAEFGVPPTLAGPVGLLLPLSELAVAIALIPRASVPWGALGALTLLLLFVVGIGANLARGRKPDCNCFGQLHSTPIGRSTLVRNGVLAAIATFVATVGWDQPGASAVGWLAGLTATGWAILALAVVLLAVATAGGWLLLGLLGRYGEVLLRLEEALEAGQSVGQAADPAIGRHTPPVGLAVGTAAPAFSLSNLDGEVITLDSLRARDVPTVLVFSDPNCGPCTALLPEIGRWQSDHADRLTAAVISHGTLEENRTKSVEPGLANVLLQRDREVAREYEANGTPAGVVVMPNGTIGSPLAQGAEAIRALVNRALEAPALLPTPIAVGPAMPASGNGGGRESATAGGAKIGEPAPALRLPDLEGRTVDLADFRGSETLVVFWNPGCGFCQRMLEDLKAWEANRPKGAPKLLVVSTGTVEANRALGLRSPVLLDEDFTTGSRFGATGTPMAVLVDAQGKIASHLAVGAESVLALTQIGQAATV